MAHVPAHLADTLKVPESAFSTMSASTTSTSSTLLPPGHPPVPVHEHLNGKCPHSNSHEYCPPQEGDLRSVCPALNTMANHGYIPRDGRNLSFSTLFRGLKNCYGLSSTLATVLVTGGFLAIGRSPFRVPFLRSKNADRTISPTGIIDLHLIGLHDRVEHDASLVHLNTPGGEKYGPVKIEEEWVPKLVGDIEPAVEGYSSDELRSERESSHHSSDSTTTSSSSHHRKSDTDGSSSGASYYASSFTIPSLRKFISDPVYSTTLVDEADVGRMRARRQKEIHPKKLDPIHAEIARGEMAIILGVWRHEAADGKGKGGIPLPWLLQWLSEERLPEVPVLKSEEATDDDSSAPATKMWRPTHKQTLSNVVKRSKAIREVTNAIESKEA